jgi:hypothetical protein
MRSVTAKPCGRPDGATDVLSLSGAAQPLQSSRLSSRAACGTTPPARLRRGQGYSQDPGSYKFGVRRSCSGRGAYGLSPFALRFRGNSRNKLYAANVIISLIPGFPFVIL